MTARYEFHIQLRIADIGFEGEEVVFKEVVDGNSPNDVLNKIRPIWKQNMEKVESMSGDGKEYGLYLDCEEIIRKSDGVSYFDDESIPQGPDVADELLEQLDVD